VRKCGQNRNLGDVAHSNDGIANSFAHEGGSPILVPKVSAWRLWFSSGTKGANHAFKEDSAPKVENS
jgi:hypothetical protein